ncbi:MAG: hypothetical protein HYY01_11600 [Chloroflexi bacterium]|nr:hypothetical protein [Chloroflexota bacterium]
MGIGLVANVRELWADVDARALSHIFNALGRVGRHKNIQIVRMSEDQGLWNTNLIVIGGQSQKSFDFYKEMQEVFYRMDAENITDSVQVKSVPRDPRYGYGIILKARNPHKTGGNGVALLIGGFGTLGTAAAGYYFAQHLEDLGRQFGTKCFGVVVRTSVTAGEQAVERVTQYDRPPP